MGSILGVLFVFRLFAGAHLSVPALLRRIVFTVRFLVYVVTAVSRVRMCVCMLLIFTVMVWL